MLLVLFHVFKPFVRCSPHAGRAVEFVPMGTCPIVREEGKRSQNALTPATQLIVFLSWFGCPSIDPMSETPPEVESYTESEKP
jgi:hypothetical protein